MAERCRLRSFTLRRLFLCRFSEICCTQYRTSKKYSCGRANCRSSSTRPRVWIVPDPRAAPAVAAAARNYCIFAEQLVDVVWVCAKFGHSAKPSSSVGSSKSAAPRPAPAATLLASSPTFSASCTFFFFWQLCFLELDYSQDLGSSLRDQV